MRGLPATLLALALLAMPTAAAGPVIDVAPPETKSITLGHEDHQAFRLAIGFAGAVEVRVRVLTAASIDVYTVSPAGYEDYTNPSASSFSYLTSGSRENVTSFDATVTQGGPVLVILDNAAVTAGGAIPHGPVSVNVTFAPSFAGLLPFVAAGILVTACVAALCWLRRHPKRPAASPGPEAPKESAPPRP